MFQDSGWLPVLSVFHCLPLRTSKLIRTKPLICYDGLTVRLTVDQLHEGHVHELHLDGVRCTEGNPLWHPIGYYTLNYIPESKVALED